MEYTKRIKPNSFKKWPVFSSTEIPTYEQSMPMNKTHVTPNEIPPIFTLPSHIPTEITSPKIKTV